VGKKALGRTLGEMEVTARTKLKRVSMKTVFARYYSYEHTKTYPFIYFLLVICLLCFLRPLPLTHGKVTDEK